MPFATIKSITAWSFSRWQDYQDCPLKAWLKHGEKIKEPGNEAMDKGTGAHNTLDAFVTSRVPEIDKRDGDRLAKYQTQIKAAAKGKLPATLQKYKTELTALRKRPNVQIEQEWAFDVAWKPVSWFAKDAWLRVKMDLAYTEATTLYNIDHKTGKIYEEKGRLQLELYGMAGLLMYPAIKVVNAQLWYHDQPRIDGNPANHTFERKDLKKMQALWLKRVAAMMNDRKFVARPGQHCKWCFFRKANAANGGGQCRY
jgi:hypothetical protein